MRLTALSPEWLDPGKKLSFSCPCCGAVRLIVPITRRTSRNFDEVSVAETIDLPGHGKWILHQGLVVEIWEAA